MTAFRLHLWTNHTGEEREIDSGLDLDVTFVPHPGMVLTGFDGCRWEVLRVEISLERAVAPADWVPTPVDVIVCPEGEAPQPALPKADPSDAVNNDVWADRDGTLWLAQVNDLEDLWFVSIIGKYTPHDFRRLYGPGMLVYRAS